MLTASTPKLDLMETWQEGDADHRVHVNFPINTHTGSADSAEEILFVVQGEGEAHAGDETVRMSAGDLAVVPAMVPHGIRNVGDTRLKVVGFFTEAKIVSEFGAKLQPADATVLEMGAQPPVVAA